MGERRREANETRLLVDRGRLNGRDLMAAEPPDADASGTATRRTAKQSVDAAGDSENLRSSGD
jgi:hypothetical protein